MSVDLITLGESLIDLPSTRRGVTLTDAPGFAKVPAGAPANVAVAAARLGLRASFLTKVGDDPFGEAIIQTFAARGVDMSHVHKDPPPAPAWPSSPSAKTVSVISCSTSTPPGIWPSGWMNWTLACCPPRAPSITAASH